LGIRRQLARTEGRNEGWNPTAAGSTTLPSGRDFGCDIDMRTAPPAISQSIAGSNPPPPSRHNAAGQDAGQG
jgi:hypothetical protein